VTNHLQRVSIAVIGIPVVIVLTMAGGVYFFILIAIISGIALHEFYQLGTAKGSSPLIGIGIAAGFILNLAFFYPQLHALIVGVAAGVGVQIPFPSQAQLVVIVTILIIVSISISELFRNKGSAIVNIGTTLFGIIYVSLFLSTLIHLREIFIPPDLPVYRYFPSVTPGQMSDVSSAIYRWGGYTIVSLFAMIWICDSAAYYFGRALGRHKLFPRVSPNKSWEGAIAGFIFAVFTAIGAKFLVLDYLSVGSAIILGIIVGIFGQIGDLIESLLKRDAGVKDSSSLIPGHGGVLDRFDSLLFVAPLAYLYIDYILFS
jgi:phosphatidate cytidylyltransferase